MIRHLHHRQASALVVAIIFVAASFLIASHFIIAMSAMRSAGRNTSTELLAQVAMRNGRAHFIRTLQEHALRRDANDDETWYTSNANTWFRTFQSDPTLESSGHFSTTYSTQVGSPGQVTVEYFSKLNPNEHNVFSTQNTGDQSGTDRPQADLIHMLGEYAWDDGSGVNGYQNWILPHAQGQRWFTIAYYDSDMLEVSNAANARYVLRYAVMPWDVTGQLAINAFPEQAYSTTILDNTSGLRERLDTMRDRHAALVKAMCQADYMSERALYPRLNNDGNYRNSEGADPCDIAFDFHLDRFGQTFEIPYGERWQDILGTMTYAPGLACPELPLIQRQVDSGQHQRRIYHRSWGGPAYWLASGQGWKYYYNFGEYDKGDRITRMLPGPRHGLKPLVYHVTGDATLMRNRSATEALIYSPWSVGQSLRRGDDCDNPQLWNLLTTRNNVLHRAIYRCSSSASRLLAQDVSERSAGKPADHHPQNFAAFSKNTDDDAIDLATTIIDDSKVVGNNVHGYPLNTPVGFDLLPPAQGHSLARDDNLTPENWAVAGTPYILGQHDTATLNARARNTWFENQSHMRSWFYGLAGDEGIGLGPRMRYVHSNRPEQTKLPAGRLSDTPESGAWLSALSTLDNILLPEIDYSGNGAPYTWQRSGEMGGFHQIATRSGRPILSQDSYETDVLDALSIALRITRDAWDGGTLRDKTDEPSNGSRRFIEDHWAGSRPMRERLPDIHAAHRLFLNILGEDVYDSRYESEDNAAAPGSRSEAPAYWHARRGILAGETIATVVGSSDLNNLSSVTGQRLRDGAPMYWIIPYVTPNHFMQTLRQIPEHPKQIRMKQGANSAGMERFLNDVRMSFFGYQYTDATGTVQVMRPLDFNHDGFAESSYFGFNDGSIAAPAGWAPGATSGTDYEPAPATGSFLVKAPYFPDTPFSVSGRVYMGKSTLFRGIIRGELYDLERAQPAAQQNLDFVYALNPSDKPDTPIAEGATQSGGLPDLHDSHVIREHRMNNEFINGVRSASDIY